MLPRDVSSFDHDPPKDVIEVLPAVRRFYTRGEITLGDYNRNWPIILCCEISKKIGLNLVYKQTVTLTTTGPTPVVTVWFMGISYRYICGYQQINPTLSEEENVREAIGALYNRLSDVGAVPSGIARLCARFELLKPVVLLTLPWFQHLMIKINETLYKDLMFDMPTRPMNETALLVKVESLTKYLQSGQHIIGPTSCGAGVPNVRLPNEKFKEIYDCSGVRSGVIQFLEDYLVEDSDPQKQRKSTTDGSPHPLLLGVPEALTSYLDGLDSRCPIPLAINEFIDFFNGGADKPNRWIHQCHRCYFKQAEPLMPALNHLCSRKTTHCLCQLTNQAISKLLCKRNLGSTYSFKICPKERRIQRSQSTKILMFWDEVRLPAYTSLYKPLPLQDLNNALKRHPRLKTLAVSWFTEENEKQKEKSPRKVLDLVQKRREQKIESAVTPRSRERKRSRDRERKREKAEVPEGPIRSRNQALGTVLSSGRDPISTKVNAKFTDIPFMMCGAIGNARDARLVSRGNGSQSAGRFGLERNDVNFAKAVLKSPDYAPILMEIANYEQNGQLFMPPTRVDQGTIRAPVESKRVANHRSSKSETQVPMDIEEGGTDPEETDQASYEEEAELERKNQERFNNSFSNLDKDWVLMVSKDCHAITLHLRELVQNNRI
ncbi:unnamed protein product, partial [Mesorhabditis belari]|uniref:Uncharacterized protein n=1 Tax=Mesorhabditis belari TaxID=2138241 RepID=A0AAF3J8B0_9BILA